MNEFRKEKNLNYGVFSPKFETYRRLKLGKSKIQNFKYCKAILGSPSNFNSSIKYHKNRSTYFSPDYTNNPLKHLTEDLTLAIQIQEKQFEFLSAFKLKGEPTVFYSKIVCAKNVLEADKIYLHRTQKADKYDSGWYIGFADARKTPSPDELESIYAFELLYKKPSFVQFLLLPTDWMIVIENNSVIAVVTPDNENILH